MSTTQTSTPADNVEEPGARRGRWTGMAARLAQVNPSAMPTAAALMLFVLMATYGEVAYGGILQYNTVSNLLINNAHLIIIAVGMTFVILTGGIDLSVGSVIAISSVAGVMLAGAGWNPWLVIAVMVAIGVLFGALAGALVEYFNVQPFIATLATMFLGRGLASMLSTTPERLADDSAIRWLANPLTIIDGPGVNDLVITVGGIIAFAVLAGGFFVLHRTRRGRTAYAIGGSGQAASLMGLPVRSTRLMVYVVSGGLSGVAAVVYTSRLGIAQNITGIGWELDAIAAVVIGGTLLTGGAGFVLGSAVGALVLGLMNLLIVRDGGINPEMTTVITGSILLLFVILQRVVTMRRPDD